MQCEAGRWTRGPGYWYEPDPGECNNNEVKGANWGSTLQAESVRFSALLDDDTKERDGSGTGWERCYTLWLSWAEKENVSLFGLLVFMGTQ